nr:tropomyosin isoform X2 [Ipomoea batatas]
MKWSNQFGVQKEMAGSDSQKQLLTLIRDFASEKSQGERRISNLKNRIGELRSEIEAATANIEEAKQIKESIEQELKGYEVELAMTEASIQTLEVFSMLRRGLLLLKMRYQPLDLISTLLRKLYESIALAFSQDNFSLEKSNEEETELAKRDLENKLAQLDSQITLEEEEYKTMQNVHKQTEVHEAYAGSRGVMYGGKESIADGCNNESKCRTAGVE